jgi:hydrogenase/urease accessory protein HupE
LPLVVSSLPALRFVALPRVEPTRDTVARSLLGLVALILLISGCFFPLRVHAHPVPFSYLDLRLNGDQIEGTLVAHTIDLAYYLKVEPPESLLDRTVAEAKRDSIRELVKSQLNLLVDGQPVDFELLGIEPLPDRQALSFELKINTSSKPGLLKINCELFLYETEHQTFLNVYEEDKLVEQEIFTYDRRIIAYRVGGRQSWTSVVGTFVPAGIYHIFLGPDHVLFIIGLLLMGGTMLRLLSIVTAFTIAHSITLSLAALNLLNPPSQLIEPVIALSIVYVGIDNLMVGRTGRDVRAWIAFFFGFIHGFGFAGVLQEFGLPRQALGWSLFSFNLGVEIGQACIVLVVASVLAMVRDRNPKLAGRIIKVGSVCVILAGAYWFIERLFL